HYYGYQGAWSTGIDVANNGGSKDFVLAAKVHWPNPGQTNDLIYIAHNDDKAPTVGVGMTPPKNGHRLEGWAQDSEPEMGTLLLRSGPNQKGNVLSAIDSGGTARWWLDAGFWIQGASQATKASLSVKANDATGRSLVMARPDGTAVYGFLH